jgi:transcriptional regulator with XRE-family HTH domain
VDASSAVQFGSLLRETRKAKGLSQAELGGGKYSGSYISHLESGRRAATPEVVDFLSHRLGVSLLEWGLAPAPTPIFTGSTIEDLLVAERARAEHDWTAAIEHATQAAQRAKAAGDSGRHWEALYLVAQGRFSSGEFAVAARLADELSRHEVALQFPVARAQALSLASIANRASDRLGWAVAFGARAVEAASAAPPIIIAEALMSLVSAMSEAGHDYAESQPYLDQLNELLPRLGSNHSKGMIAWTMGVAAFMAREVTKGLALHEQAKEWLDARRDFRLWLRFHNVAARWRLNAGIVEGTKELLHTASLGLQILGNNYDVVELRQVEAMYQLRTDDPLEAARIMSEVLDDPVLGGENMSRGASELILGHAFRQLGRTEAARDRYTRAALQFESEGRLRAAVDAWRHSVGQTSSGDFLTQG